MKSLNLLAAIFIFATAFTSCTFDDETIDPAVEAYNQADVANGELCMTNFGQPSLILTKPIL